MLLIALSGFDVRVVKRWSGDGLGCGSSGFSGSFGGGNWKMFTTVGFKAQATENPLGSDRSTRVCSSGFGILLPVSPSMRAAELGRADRPK